MFEQVSEDIKQAMKAKDKAKLDALRMLKSKLIENKTSTAPRAEMDVVVGYHKQLKESLEMFPAGSEQQGKIEAELSIIAGYMPKAMDEAEVRTLVKSLIADPANGNFGLVMKALTPQIKGKFDGKRASEIVKEMMGA